MTCTIADCPRTVLARGWCNAHYKRWRKYGNPLKLSTGRKRKPYCVNGHRFDRANTYHRKDGKRTCRTCARYFSRTWHRRQRAAGRQFDQAPKEWKMQYQSDIRTGIRTPKRHPKPNLTRSIADLLANDGGWWTALEIASRFDAKPGTVRTSLERLRVKGLAESRRIVLTGRDVRTEWKAARF